MKKIAIIGATGEVGFKLVEKLSSYYNMNCILRNVGKRDFTNFESVKIFKIEDISDIAMLSEAIRDCDLIINAGYIWFAKDILKAISLNDKRPEHIIFTGSTGIFTKLPSQGAEIKREAEKFIFENYNIPWTIIRPTMIYGHKNDRNISRLVRVFKKIQIMPLIGKGDALIQPIFIDDLIKAFEVMLFVDKFYNKTFNIGGAHAVTNKELFQKVSAALNKKIFFVSFSPFLVLSVIKILKFIGIKLVSEEQIHRFQEDKAIDMTEFVDVFQFLPRSIDDGLFLLVKDVKEGN